jgi:hypothetical protein
MSLLGIHLTLLIGPGVALPAPALLMESLERVEISQSDELRSGFQIVFQASRSGPAEALDSAIVGSPLLKPFNRVIVILTLNATPRVLIDGIITHQQYSPGFSSLPSALTITGEDVSVMMDLEEKTAEHPAQDETAIALKIIGRYAQYGLIPQVIPPPSFDLPLPIERVPVQQATDLQYLKQMAERFGYVFYITAGPVPFVNTAYWGPPVRLGVPQPALSLDMGPATNVDSFDVQNNALQPTLVEGKFQDRTTNQEFPVETFASLRASLSTFPSWLVNESNLRRTRFRKSAVNTVEAYARAQAITDDSADALTAEGQLDALRYGDVLQPRGLVGVRGAGYLHDGLWYVKRVSHQIARGSYKQNFTLTRDGQGSTVPVVMP